MLGTFILYGDGNPRWNMSYPNSTVGGIYMLTTRTTRSICVDSQIFLPQLDIYLYKPRNVIRQVPMYQKSQPNRSITYNNCCITELFIQ